ncbi:MAG: hypothetical protein ACRENG_00090 [bacterium]
MWTDPIVDEIHKIRQAHAERFNYDLQAIFDDLKAQEKKNKHRVVSLPIKRQLPAQERPSKQRKRGLKRRLQPTLASGI